MESISCKLELSTLHENRVQVIDFTIHIKVQKKQITIHFQYDLSKDTVQGIVEEMKEELRLNVPTI